VGAIHVHNIPVVVDEVNLIRIIPIRIPITVIIKSAVLKSESPVVINRSLHAEAMTRPKMPASVISVEVPTIIMPVLALVASSPAILVLGPLFSPSMIITVVATTILVITPTVPLG
jgi:hypothetical protein